MDLLKKSCVPCEKGVPRLEGPALALLLPEVPGWTVAGDSRELKKQFVFKDFAQAMTFVNAMARVAEKEAHHPDFSVRYRTVDVTLNTHVIGGLSENDFILAAKIDELIAQQTPSANPTPG